MLTYRGDKFVKGKSYKLEESLTFIRRDEDNLVFESADNKEVIMTEAEFESKKSELLEKINQENKEINELISKVLRSKSLARKNEDLLKSKGITIDYENPQGVTLIGPNGRELSASSKEVYGPSKPGQNNTHSTDRGSYWEPELKEYQEKVAKLKAMKRDDIIRAYKDLDTKSALKKYKEDLKNAESALASYRDRVDHDHSEAKTKRREGHLSNPESSYRDNFDKEKADTTVDYLNYLSKPNTGDDFRNNKSYETLGSGKEDSWYNPRYKTKNPVDNSKSDTIYKYNELKNDIKDAQSRLDDRKYNNGFTTYRTAMTDKQLEKEVNKKKEELERKIKELQKQYDDDIKYITNRNKENIKNKETEIKALKDKEKELDKFLKSKGVRESELFEVKNYIKESYNSDYMEIYGDFPDYTSLRRIVSGLYALSESLEEDGYKEFGDKMYLIAQDLSSLTADIEEVYEK